MEWILSQAAGTAAVRPRQRVEQRESQILDAAMYLFAEHGFHGTSTRSIAMRAGVSEGTIFNYFSSKMVLLEAIIGKFYEELTESAREGVQKIDSIWEQLVFLAENHIRGVVNRDNAIFMRLIYVYAGENSGYFLDYRNSYIYKLNKPYTGIFDRVITEGIARNDLRSDLNLQVTRDLFFGGLEYATRSQYSTCDSVELLKSVRNVVEPVWTSIQANAGAGQIEPTVSPDRLEKVCERLEAITNIIETKSS